VRWASAPGQPPPHYVRPQAPKKGPGCFRVVVLMMLAAFLFCCCFVSAVMESAEDPLAWKDLEKQLPSTNERFLGNALVPDTLSTSLARQYHWRKAFSSMGLGYGVSSDVHDEIEDQFQKLSRDFRYRSGEGNNFTWAPPMSCKNKEWKCVFDAMAKQNADDIAPLTELFRKEQREKNLNILQTTELVVSFVQNITYRLPTEETAAFGMLPPVVVVADGSGDCDSKALLSVIILQQLGVDAHVLLGSSLGHAALGVNLPVTGKKFPHQGKKYAFVEVTQPGWGLGQLPPEYDVSKAWKVIPVDVP
jgi:hypothetical protein